MIAAFGKAADQMAPVINPQFAYDESSELSGADSQQMDDYHSSYQREHAPADGHETPGQRAPEMSQIGGPISYPNIGEEIRRVAAAGPPSNDPPAQPTAQRYTRNPPGSARDRRFQPRVNFVDEDDPGDEEPQGLPAEVPRDTRNPPGSVRDRRFQPRVDSVDEDDPRGEEPQGPPAEVPFRDTRNPPGSARDRRFQPRVDSVDEDDPRGEEPQGLPAEVPSRDTRNPSHNLRPLSSRPRPSSPPGSGRPGDGRSSGNGGGGQRPTFLGQPPASARGGKGRAGPPRRSPLPSSGSQGEGPSSGNAGGGQGSAFQSQPPASAGGGRRGDGPRRWPPSASSSGNVGGGQGSASRNQPPASAGGVRGGRNEPAAGTGIPLDNSSDDGPDPHPNRPARGAVPLHTNRISDGVVQFLEKEWNILRWRRQGSGYQFWIQESSDYTPGWRRNFWAATSHFAGGAEAAVEQFKSTASREAREKFVPMPLEEFRELDLVEITGVIVHYMDEQPLRGPMQHVIVRHRKPDGRLASATATRSVYVTTRGPRKGPRELLEYFDVSGIPPPPDPARREVRYFRGDGQLPTPPPDPPTNRPTQQQRTRPQAEQGRTDRRAEQQAYQTPPPEQSRRRDANDPPPGRARRRDANDPPPGRDRRRDANDPSPERARRRDANDPPPDLRDMFEQFMDRMDRVTERLDRLEGTAGKSWPSTSISQSN